MNTLKTLNRSNVPAIAALVAPDTPDGAVFAQLSSFLWTLFERWQDEQEYEDIADYGAAIKKNLKVPGVTFESMTKRPFGFRFRADAKVFHMTANARGDVVCKLVASEWSGSLAPESPDEWWVDDDTGEYINATTNERMSATAARRIIKASARKAKA